MRRRLRLADREENRTRTRTRTRTNTNPNGTEANAAGRRGNARALRKQSKCGMIPQNNKEEGARAKKLVTCGTRGPLGRGQSVPFSAQGAYCSAPEPKEALTGQELKAAQTKPTGKKLIRRIHFSWYSLRIHFSWYSLRIHFSWFSFLAFLLVLAVILEGKFCSFRSEIREITVAVV